MERIRHIKETSQPAKRSDFESDPFRDLIEQADEYDPSTETNPEQIKIREYLNAIDEDVLREIFAEYVCKSGTVDSTMNWISFEKVRILHKTPEEEAKSSSPYGSASSKYGVKLYSHLLAHDPERTLWTLIHEQCHAVSQDRWRNGYTYDEHGKKDGLRSSLKSGVARHSIATKFDAADDGDEQFSANKGINEGITELLTERIFKEYKRRTGTESYGTDPLGQEYVTKLSDETAAKMKFGAYERYWQNAKMYIGIIASLTDIPRDVVEESIIRTYLRNGAILPDMFDSEIEEMLVAINPDLPGVLYRMLNSRKGESLDLAMYVSYLNDERMPQEIQTKIIAALRDFKEEWGDEAYKRAPHTV